MKITVFGANGKVGRQVVRLELQRGHRVTAFVHRNAGELEGLDVTIARGDVHKAKDVVAAVKESDAVICALGSWGTPTKDTLTSAMRTIIPAMEASGVKRIISLTGAGAQYSADRPGLLDTASHALMNLAAGKVLGDGEQHIQLLHDTTLDWTVLRSPVMTPQSHDHYTLNLTSPPPWALVSRAAVATAMVEQLEDAQFYRLAPFIHR